MGRRPKIAWEESPDELKALYEAENHPVLKPRMQALWLLAEGKQVYEVAEMLDMSYRAVERWIRWYKDGGVDLVRSRLRGRGSSGAPPRLNYTRQSILSRAIQQGQLPTVQHCIEFVQLRWDIDYSYSGMHAMLRRMGFDVQALREHASNN